MAHQSPLISIPRKTTTDADWAGPIRSTIAHSFGESPESYAEEIATLQRCRQDAVRGAGSDTTARDLLYKYFGQLELLELRFSEVKVSFGWNDAFTNKLTTQTSLAFEKASIIHLLSSVLSSLAASQSRADPEGLKRAYFNCRATAGMLTYINENFLHAPSTDLSRDVVHLLINLSLAQATEVFMEKLVDEKKAAGLVARTANQLATMYSQLNDEIKEFMGKGVFERSWMRLIEAKACLFASVAQYQKGLADASSNKHGAALVRWKKADEDAKEAVRIAQAFAYQFTGEVTLPSDAGSSIVEIAKAHAAVVAEAKTQGTKDNDLIYHDILPAEASLPPIDKLPAATPVVIQEVYQNPDVSKLIGPDIFARLIPLAVHESASVYSEEKAKLVRGEVERVELSEVEVRAALEHLGLPAAVNAWRRMADGDDADADVDVSSELLSASREAANSSTEARVRKVEGERVRVERELQELTAQLDNESRECERARAKYSPNFTQSPSGPQTSSFRQTITANLSSLSNAASSDAALARLWAEIAPDLAVLSSGPDALRAQARDVALGKTKAAEPVDPSLSLLDLNDEEQVAPRLDAAETEALRTAAKEAGEKLARLDKIRKERDDVLRDLKAKIQSDDVSNLLLLNRRSSNVEPQLFAAELEKFRPYQSRLAATLSASKTLTGELEAIVQRVEQGRGVRERNRGAKEKASRVKSWERRLVRAAASNNEVKDALVKAEGFYSSLDGIVYDLRREIRSFVQQRDAERNKMVSDIETRNRLGGASSRGATASPPVPPAPGLSSQLAGLSLGGGGYPTPPAPPKPQSPSASPYDFSSLSSLPRAFDSSPSQQPSPPAKPAYPSFPSAPSTTPGSGSAYPAPPPQHQSSYPAPPSQSPYSAAYPAPPAQQPQPQSSYPTPPTPQQYPAPPPQRQYSASQPAYPPPPSSGSAAYPPPPPRPSYPAYPPPQQYGSQPPQQQQPAQQQYGGYSSPPSNAYPAPPQQPSYAQYPAPGQYGQPQQTQQQQQYGQPPQQYGQQPPQGQQQYGGYRY